ncbi:MAG: hypothetical protein LBG95_03805 [Treponema sp.]|jgi:hypothetical protein|nr:hypothetical protein [Treponema sp.]
MKKFKIIWVIALALVNALIPHSVEAAESSSLSSGVDFSIRFFDRRIYYVEGDPIYIQVSITNNSPATYRFKLADERAFSLDFDARTLSNRALEPADSLIRKRTRYQQIFFREIAVESGESFSFVEDLRQYVNVSEPGTLVIKACLYPELFRSDLAAEAAFSGGAAEGALESKRLNLSIRPANATGPDGIPIEMDTATGATLVRERLAPDQVVEYMLTARQRSQWEKFFLYLDLETMLQTHDADRGRKWLSESEEGRRRMIDQYRLELKNSVTDGTISVIPSSFEIEWTQYNGFEGRVTVLEKFRNNIPGSNSKFTELKRYTYYVRLKDNIWSITDYSVVNLGTE